MPWLRSVAGATEGTGIMKRNRERILTTHTGSLPRSTTMIALLREQEEGRLQSADVFDAEARSAVAEALRRQYEVGLDIVNDGEQAKVDYTTYVKHRLNGFEGQSESLTDPDTVEFPEWAAMQQMFGAPFRRRPACVGPISWKDWDAVERDIQVLKEASAGQQDRQVFMTSASPGQIARFLQNRHYPDDESYLYALADVMKREYQAIADAGFVLQLDCPDLALGRHTQFSHLTLEEFRKVAELHVEVLNYAVADIPPERMRMHACWGSGGGPHHRDVPLKGIVDVVLKARPSGFAFVGANGRHEHEWKVWKEVTLPEGKVIIPGVIDNTTNIIEHPETVAERILRYAGVVGPENVIAGVDCGFGTFADRVQVDSQIVWLKLRSLVKGAEIASADLQ